MSDLQPIDQSAVRSGSKPQIVTIGGGTGTFTVLSGLKRYPVQLTAVVTMADSGGSSGRLRDELGGLPPGDLRQALVALSYSSQLMRDLFNYRFESGDLKGHNFGNLFVSAMEKVTGDINTASKRIADILKVRGQALPVTLDPSHLAVELENGQIIESEHLIDEPRHDGNLRIVRTYLKPAARLNPDVAEAIKQANLIVIGPGDVYTSIMPNLVVEGMQLALSQSSAKIVYVCNLMTKYGQTNGMSARDHVEVIERQLGHGILDAVLINQAVPELELLEKYATEGSLVSADPAQFAQVAYQPVFTDLLASSPIKTQQADALKRSFIRHDSRKLAAALIRLLS